MHTTTVADVKAALMQYHDPVKAAVLPRFFKTGPGEYGEGDVFMGVAVPNVRKVAKECQHAPMQLIGQLLDCDEHECRMCALVVLANRFKKSKCEQERRDIYGFYLAHTARVNNWDLVDTSCPIIVGGYLKDKPRTILRQLLDHPLLWNKRIAIVSCLAFIRDHDFADIFALTGHLLRTDPRPHDLMQKACGWMLREVGRKGGMPQLLQFLEQHAATMPRTMLRYAIEHLSHDERSRFMHMKAGH